VRRKFLHGIGRFGERSGSMCDRTQQGLTRGYLLTIM
jgi:hypothetical protein